MLAYRPPKVSIQIGNDGENSEKNALTTAATAES